MRTTSYRGHIRLAEVLNIVCSLYRGFIVRPLKIWVIEVSALDLVGYIEVFLAFRVTKASRGF